MDEITLEEIPVAEPPEEKQLIQVVQLPIIAQHLEAKALEVKAKTEQAMRLVVSEETLIDVRAVRTALNREYEDLENRRKAVKRAVMAPYEEFEAVYNRCVKLLYESANKDLGSKIHEVEQGIISNCLNDLKSYFVELVKGEHIDWLTFDRMHMKIGLTEARTVKHGKQRGEIAGFVYGVVEDVRSINKMENAAEIMAEYKKCLKLADAINTVSERHRRIEEEKKRREEWEAKQAADRAAAAKVEAVTPDPAPAPAPAPVPTAEPIPQPAPAPAPAQPADNTVYTCRFAVHATKEQLKKLKNFLIQEGISYE